jgi:hypothetical protein
MALAPMSRTATSSTGFAGVGGFARFAGFGGFAEFTGFGGFTGF